MTEWETVKMFKCPNCGELVQDMDDACNHVCKNTSSDKEIEYDNLNERKEGETRL